MSADTTQRIKLFLSQLQGWPGTVVAVTKTADTEQCRLAYSAGLKHFGENRVQNLLARQAELADLPVQWHLIGPVQSNKVNKLIGKVSLIHSIDSLALAQKISQTVMQVSLHQPQSVLLQVNWAAEPQKHGFAPDTLLSDIKTMIALPGIWVEGLMFIAPQGLERDVLKQLFNEVAVFKNRVQQHCGQDLPQLSMGMSQDFDIAMHCGATIIRVGSRLFA